MTRPPLRLGVRRRAAWLLRWVAARLEDRRVIPHHSGIPHRHRDRAELQALADRAVHRGRHLSLLAPDGSTRPLPDGYESITVHPAVQGDLARRAAAVQQDAKDRWNALMQQQVLRVSPGHEGPAAPHPCRCDSRHLPPEQRGQVHACLCTLPEEEASHLPPGGPPFIVPRAEWEAEGLEQTIARHAREGEQP